MYNQGKTSFSSHLKIRVFLGFLGHRPGRILERISLYSCCFGHPTSFLLQCFYGWVVSQELYKASRVPFSLYHSERLRCCLCFKSCYPLFLSNLQKSSETNLNGYKQMVSRASGVAETYPYDVHGGELYIGIGEPQCPVTIGATTTSLSLVKTTVTLTPSGSSSFSQRR